MSTRLIATGIVGTLIAALCCFTPILAVSFGGLGLAWAVGYLDLFLLPALAFFIAMTGYGLWLRMKSA